MRPTHSLLALSLLASACMGPTGNGRTNGSGSDDPDDDGTCDSVEDYKHDISMHTMDSLAATLPEGCYNVVGKLTIDSASVTSLKKLGKIRSVTDLEITGSGLASIDTVVPLAVYDGGLTFANNAKLTDIGNLELHHVSHVTIDHNDLLASLDALPLETIDGDTGDARRDGSLTITNNAKLTDLGLPTLSRVDGPIKISNNGGLTNIALGALASVGTFPWKGTIEISNNPNLTGVGSVQLVSLSGDLTIKTNPKLATLGGLMQLQRVTGALTIDGTALTSLGAFGTPFAYVDGTLTITNNPVLVTVDRVSHMMDGGADNWRAGGIGGSLVITNNAQLPFCEAHAIDYCTNTQGSVTISGNKQNNGNCSSWCKDLQN